MKRHIIPLIFMVLPTLVLHGQSLKLGLWAAGGVANLEGFAKGRLVAEGGLAAQYGLSDHFGIAGNLGYALKGGMEHVSLPDQLYDQYEEDQRTTLHYANLDLSAYYSPISQLQFGLGPYIATRLAGFRHGAYQITDNGVATEGSYRDDIGFQYHLLDGGVQASLQWNLHSRLGIHFRFRQGLTNAYGVSIIPLVQRNQSLTLGVVMYLK